MKMDSTGVSCGRLSTSLFFLYVSVFSTSTKADSDRQQEQFGYSTAESN